MTCRIAVIDTEIQRCKTELRILRSSVDGSSRRDKTNTLTIEGASVNKTERQNEIIMRTIGRGDTFKMKITDDQDHVPEFIKINDNVILNVIYGDQEKWITARNVMFEQGTRAKAKMVGERDEYIEFELTFISIRTATLDEITKYALEYGATVEDTLKVTLGTNKPEINPGSNSPP